MLTAKKCLAGLAAILASTVIAACRSAGSGSSAHPNPRVLPAEGVATPDASEIYRQIGLLAAPDPVAFVGSISSFATGRPDARATFTRLSSAA